MRGHLELGPYRWEGESFTVPVENSAAPPFPLPRGTAWLVAPKIDGYWGPPILIEVGAGTAEVRAELPVDALGRLSGRFAPPRGEEMPGEVEVRLVNTPKSLRSGRPPRGSLSCPVGEGGRWSCEVPAAEVSVMIAAEGYIPLYRWDLKVEPWKERALGQLPLKRGASLAGWVEVTEGEIDPRTSRARLIPRIAPDASPLLRQQIEEAAAQTHLTPAGFFQLVGVPPGSYLLQIHQPRWATAMVEPIDIGEGRHVVLDKPILLHPALSLQIQISPPQDWLGRPWDVDLHRVDEVGSGTRRDPLFAGQLPGAGRFLVPDQSPGKFLLSVADSLGNPFAAERWTVTGPLSAIKEVEIDLVPIAGTVRLGDEPLPATLSFGGHFGSIRVELEADGDGEFSGVLPHAGWWRVDVDAIEPAIEARVHVEVEDPGGGEASVEISVPDTEVFGRVTDPEGRGVAGASVSASSGESLVPIRTQEGGLFSLRGLPEGRCVLSAEAPVAGVRQEARPVVVEAVPGAAVGPIELRLVESRSFRGRVEGPHGPVPGATVQLRAIDSWRWATASTDLEGRFSTELPAGTETVHAVVAAPGQGLRALYQPAPEGQVRLPVSPERGMLRLAMPVTGEDFQRLFLSLTVFQDGAAIPFPALTRWASSQGIRFDDGKPFTFPDLAAGHYRACLAPRPAVLPGEMDGWLGSHGRCAEGFLAAGGELLLELPEPAEAAR